MRKGAALDASGEGGLFGRRFSIDRQRYRWVAAADLVAAGLAAADLAAADLAAADLLAAGLLQASCNNLLRRPSQRPE